MKNLSKTLKVFRIFFIPIVCLQIFSFRDEAYGVETCSLLVRDPTLNIYLKSLANDVIDSQHLSKIRTLIQDFKILRANVNVSSVF